MLYSCDTHMATVGVKR